MDDREKAKKLIDDLPEDELANAVSFLELMRDVDGFSAETEEFLEDFDSDHDFALDADDDETKPTKHRRFSFKMVSKRQAKDDDEPKVRRWEWGF
jgi:hypothetical protein